MIIFHDFFHNLVECYADDRVVKTKDTENHPHDLRKVFEKLRMHPLQMNPLKCAFELYEECSLGLLFGRREYKLTLLKSRP